MGRDRIMMYSLAQIIARIDTLLVGLTMYHQGGQYSDTLMTGDPILFMDIMYQVLRFPALSV